MKLLMVTALAAALCGCATKAGRWYPIIGLGWVVVNTNQPNATIVRTTLVGAGVSTLPPGAVVGLSRSQTVLVTTNSNLVLEIK